MNENLLYEYHAKMQDSVEATKPCFNWHYDLEISAVDLDRLAIIDVRDEAAKWRESTPPPDMYFTHGEYYKDGVQHIIAELKHKPTSNRALYSLLSQQDISGKGDDPIPSFLAFQCQMEGEKLYCTASFRALEVSRFLKINLEEIRQTLNEICNELPTVKTIQLHIFAFHAYVRTSAVAALRKPKIDVTSESELMRLLQKGSLNELGVLLNGLKQTTTVTSANSLRALHRILHMADAALHTSIQSKQVLLIPKLNKVISACDDLITSRKSASRGIQASAKINAFHTAVSDLQATLLN